MQPRGPRGVLQPPKALCQACWAPLRCHASAGLGNGAPAAAACLACNPRPQPTTAWPACRAGPGAGAAAAPVCLPLAHLQAPGQGAGQRGAAAARAARHAAAAPPPRGARARAGGRGAGIPAQASLARRAGLRRLGTIGHSFLAVKRKEWRWRWQMLHGFWWRASAGGLARAGFRSPLLLPCRAACPATGAAGGAKRRPRALLPLCALPAGKPQARR